MLRTETLQQSHHHVVLPFLIGIFGTLLFYIMSPYILPRQFFLHFPTLLFLWLTSKRSTSFSVALAISMGLMTEVLLSLTVGAGVFTYLASYGVIRFIEPLWDLHYRFHRIGYGLIFIAVWHGVFWFMH